MIQDIFIIGATGKVGSTLIKQIFEKKDTDPRVHKNPTRLRGLASHSFFHFADNITKKEAEKFLRDPKQFTTYSDINQFITITKKCTNLTFIDVTASAQPLSLFHKNVIKRTKHNIVTANKNPISLSDFKSFTFLTKEPHRYGYRCSVMAGAEAVTFLRDLKDVNDTAHSILGCFSGTLGYICSELDKGKPFSKIVKTAYEKGYTEPDPRDDLNGLDVARKLLVLARTTGKKAEISDLDCHPFIPKKFFVDEGIPSFLKKIKKLDKPFKEKVQKAHAKGKVLRYMAQMAHDDLSVSLKEVDRSSELGMLKGTLNKIVVISDAYPEDSPYSVQAPGAGLKVTAQNIRRDLLYLLKERSVAK